MVFTATLVPSTADRIVPKLQGSAEAAASQCSGGDEGTACGVKRYEDKWDGKNSLEIQMTALSVGNLESRYGISVDDHFRKFSFVVPDLTIARVLPSRLVSKS